MKDNTGTRSIEIDQLTIGTNIQQRANGIENDGRPVVIHQLGDFDPATRQPEALIGEINEQVPPLFDSAQDFAISSRRLIARKHYIRQGGGQ